jgi:hypothetical protein
MCMSMSMNVVVAGGGGVRLHPYGPRTEQDRSHPGGPGPHVSCLSSLLFCNYLIYFMSTAM